MATRWEITKAVRASDLPAPARLIMLVLADVAEVGTAEIPERFTPSLTVLAKETGLDKSTVKRHLSALETAGWVARTRPSVQDARVKFERTCYRLMAPNLGAQDADLGADSAHLGAQDAQPRRTVRHYKEERSLPDQLPDQVPSSSATPPAEPERADVEKVCRHLADRITDNGSKRPAITAAWRTQARLLLDADGRTVEQVIRAIDWCQADEFWRANVLSMPTLRKKYDQLRLAAQRPNGRASPRGSTTDARMAQSMAAGIALQARIDRKEISA